jgi:hypothetical protein
MVQHGHKKACSIEKLNLRDDDSNETIEPIPTFSQSRLIINGGPILLAKAIN